MQITATTITSTTKRITTRTTSKPEFEAKEKSNKLKSSLPFIIIGFVAVIILGTVFWMFSSRWKRKTIPETRRQTFRHRSKIDETAKKAQIDKLKRKNKSSPLKGYQPKWGDLDPTCCLKLEIARIPSTMSQESISSSTSQVGFRLNDDIKKQLNCIERTNQSEAEKICM